MYFDFYWLIKTVHIPIPGLCTKLQLALEKNCVQQWLDYQQLIDLFSLF